jgi:hypothetical protein
MSPPTTDPIQRAFRLCQEADLILQEVRLHEILSPVDVSYVPGAISSTS